MTKGPTEIINDNTVSTDITIYYNINARRYFPKLCSSLMISTTTDNLGEYIPIYVAI
jgi:hypothetical protein